jgi:catechol 2,3-dioxygenase-like lactoylglutathione lyase family enzyme
MSSLSIRYIIDDMPAAVHFYTQHLGFSVQHDAAPAFVAVARDGVRLLLSGDGSSGKRPLADGRPQSPGGWNRLVLEVEDLQAEVARLRAAGVFFRTQEVVTGPGGAQVIIDDPSGNAVELFEPKR